MSIYEEGDDTITTQLNHWKLLRREQVLLHAARQHGLNRVGLQVVPPLQITQANARNAIEMHLLLQSLAMSPFARERWTLSDTSREMYTAPPSGTFKKEGQTVEVVFDGEKDNAMQYQKWTRVYYTDERGCWQRVTSHCDLTGIYFDRGNGREYYVHFNKEAKKYSTTGTWEVHDGPNIHLPVVPVTSSSPAPHLPGGLEIHLHGPTSTGYPLPIWDPGCDKLLLGGRGGAHQETGEGRPREGGSGGGTTADTTTGGAYTSPEDTPRTQATLGGGGGGGGDTGGGRPAEPSEQLQSVRHPSTVGPGGGARRGPGERGAAAAATQEETKASRRGRPRGPGSPQAGETAAPKRPLDEPDRVFPTPIKRPRGRPRRLPPPTTPLNNTNKLGDLGGGDQEGGEEGGEASGRGRLPRVGLSPPSPHPPRLSTPGVRVASQSPSPRSPGSPPTLLAIPDPARRPPAPVQGIGSTPGDPPDRAQHSSLKSGPPCLLIIKGSSNQVKCLRYRLKSHFSDLFLYISTTWQWVPASGQSRIGRSRILVMCESSAQRDRFTKAVKIPRGMSVEHCSMLTV